MSHLTDKPETPHPTGTRRRITETERQRFAEVLDRTTSVKEAAEAIGISLPTAYRLARSCGWEAPNAAESGASRQRGKSKTKYTQEQKNTFFKAFDRLQNVSAAAREAGFPIYTCYQWVNKAGLNTSPPRGQKREEFLRLRAAGKSRKEAAGIVGVHGRTAEDWDHGVRRSGNVRIYPDGRRVDYKRGVTTTVDPSGALSSAPAPTMAALDQAICSRYLSLQEREQIYALHQTGESMNAIARSLGRAVSTISRELRRNNSPLGYQPYSAHRQSVARRPRPKPSKLAADGDLRDYVVKKLELGWSPEQISHRIIADHPDQTEMRVCHETIYQAIYVQARGGLKREVEQSLRTGRARRKQHRNPASRTPRFRDPMINISERPASVEDRAVPGDWEGDLILGAGNKTAIATLVERTTRFVALVHLPVDHTAESVRDGLIKTMGDLPKLLRGSLTWDQGVEMSKHAAFSTATDMEVYFCDPHSPWQRGTNENTNGLLRQYFPKGTDLSVYGPEDLEHACNLLNGRPRKTLGWKTPAERLDELLLVA